MLFVQQQYICSNIKKKNSLSDDPTFLSFKKAELILLIKDNEFSSNPGWVDGQNERTGKKGAVPTDAIYILPTLTKPSNEVLVGIFFYSNSLIIPQRHQKITSFLCNILHDHLCIISHFNSHT